MVKEISSSESSSDDRTADVPAATEHAFQASFGQERLWVLEHLRADVPLYMHSFAVRCRGRLDERALRAAVAAVVARHETLRTRFEIRDGILVQLVVPALEVDVPVVDLTRLGRDAEAEARRLAESLDDEPVDLARPPLVRFRLLRVAPEDHVLVVAIHHIVSDGWSIDVLLRELGACYDAIVAGETPSLPELSIQYADYAVWQREWLSGAELGRQVAYWSDALAGAPALLELPTDHPRPPVQSFDGATAPVAIPPEVVARLNAVAGRTGATLFMTLTAALAALLHRYASQTDVLLATPVAGRRRSEVEPLIGFFVNTLILRTDCSGNPSFAELLERVRRTALDAYAHQDLPFEKLVEELNPERDLSHLPLAQVMLVLQSAPADRLSLRGVEVAPYPLAEDMAPYDLTVELSPDGDGLKGAFLYNTDLFEPATIEALVTHFERFVAAVAAPHVRIDDVPLLDRAEVHALAHGWVDSRPELAGPPLLHELLEQTAGAVPDDVALDAPGRTVTYGELDHMAKALAAKLGAAGIGREDRVGVYFDKGVELIVALCGVLRSGAAFVPLDPDGPAERLRLILEDLRPALLLTGEREHERLAGAAAELAERAPVWRVTERGLRDVPGEHAAPPVDPRDLAYVIYTSGSTGRPKGVMIEQAGVVGMVRSMAERYEVTAAARFLQFMSIGFDASFSEIFPTLLVGGTLVLRERAALLPGPGLIDLLERDRVTHLLTTPSALGVMRAAELPELRTLIVCGEACSADLVARWAAGRRFVNAYGPTEVTVCTHTCHVVEEGKPPIGYGLANTESYVLDPALNETPTGLRGELHIASPGVARGYLGRPDLTAAAFVPNPFGPAGARMYKTGDVVRRRRDGQIDFLGRVDDQAKVRGFRIEPGEIESALAVHPEVDDVAVVTDRDPAGATRLVCYFTSAVGAEVEGLRGFLSRRLPSYMIPAAFLRLDDMPRSPAGKLDRKSLPDPRSIGTDDRTAYVAPATATEKETARVWGEVLGLDRVGVRDKFFEIGGNSLKIVELFERLEDLYPGALSVAELFEHPTVTAMATAIDARADSGGPSLTGFEL